VKLQRDPDHVGRDHTQSCFEQLLSGLVSLEDHDDLRIHRPEILVSLVQRSIETKSRTDNLC